MTKNASDVVSPNSAAPYRETRVVDWAEVCRVMGDVTPEGMENEIVRWMAILHPRQPLCIMEKCARREMNLFGSDETPDFTDPDSGRQWCAILMLRAYVLISRNPEERETLTTTVLKKGFQITYNCEDSRGSYWERFQQKT